MMSITAMKKGGPFICAALFQYARKIDVRNGAIDNPSRQSIVVVVPGRCNETVEATQQVVLGHAIEGDFAIVHA